MAENKTKPTAVKIDDFLATVDPKRREDSATLVTMMKSITKSEPVMWGPSIIGFGQYHYEYDSGHKGDICLLGFSPRKAALTIYVMPGADVYADLLPRLGKFTKSVACLYVKRLSDIDVGVLKEILVRSVKLARATPSATKAKPPASKKSSAAKSGTSAKRSKTSRTR